MMQPRFVGKYEILEEIGRGGFGVIYKAQYEKDKELQFVALKVLRNVADSEPALVQRFLEEARIAANLHHPNIIPVFDSGDADGVLYLAMALIRDGRTLRDLLAEQGCLPLERALLILAQVASALDYLHIQKPPLIHRDIKPANVLLETEGDKLKVVLTDFGLARSMEASTKFTKDGTILGTPAYMAPEQADPEQWGKITPLTDVYALGVMAYEMLTGHVPFEGKALAVLHGHAYKEPPPPLSFAPDLGTSLAALLMQALAKPPAQRYSSAGALVAAFRQSAETRSRQEKQLGELVQLLDKAQAARKVNDWLAAMDYCVRVIQIDPTHRAALQIMAEVTDELQRESAEAARKLRSQRYEEGRQALAEEKWQAAIAAFEDVIAGDPDFQDVQKLLTRAQISDYEHRGITSPAESRVRVITITGPSGAGKSTTVQYLLALADRNFRPALVPKYTTRSPRDDDRGEVICADAIPEECDLVYELYAVRYGLQLSTVFDLIMKGLSPVIILNDIRAVEDVRNSWRGLVRSVFIYREVPSLAKYRALVEKRGVKNEMESMLRYQKAQAIYRLYIENIHLFDHVILNSGSFEDLEAQVKQIVKGLRQDLNWPLRRRR